MQFENIAINVSLTVNNTQAETWGLITNSINSRACGERCLVSAVKCPFMPQTSERYGTDLASRVIQRTSRHVASSQVGAMSNVSSRYCTSTTAALNSSRAISHSFDVCSVSWSPRLSEMHLFFAATSFKRITSRWQWQFKMLESTHSHVIRFHSSQMIERSEPAGNTEGVIKCCHQGGNAGTFKIRAGLRRRLSAGTVSNFNGNVNIFRCACRRNPMGRKGRASSADILCRL